MAGKGVCIFCSGLFSEEDEDTTLGRKGLNGILRANATSKKKIFPSVGDKVRINQKNPNILMYPLRTI